MRIALEASLLALAVVTVGFGIWLLARSTFPGWMKGIWKWPLGDCSSPQLVHLMGWSSLLVGVACVPTAYVESTWDRSTATLLSAMVAMFFAGGSLFAWSWGFFLSRGRIR